MLDVKALLNKLACCSYKTATIGGWNCRIYADGRIEAEKDITTGSSWSVVVSPVAHNQTTVTPPTGMTVTGGFANLKSSSAYVISSQIQMLNGTTYMEVHRLASSSASFTFHVTLIGTYS